MDIGPVPGVSVISAPRAQSAAPEVTAAFRIEALANAGDDTYTPSGKKAAGAEEDDEEELDDLIAEDNEPPDGAISSSPANSDSSVSYFA